MLHNFSILPIELQASVVDLRAAGVPEHTIDILIGRMFTALEAKSNKIQTDVWRIEESLGEKVEKIGDKLQGDLRTALGETNGMLSDIHTAVQGQEAAVLGLRAEFQSVGERLSDIDAWRTEVDQERESFRESRDQSLEQRTRTEAAVHDLMTEFTAFRDEIHELIANSIPPDKAEQYRAFLDELMQREAGG